MTNRSNSKLSSLTNVLLEKYKNIVGKHRDLSVERIIEFIIGYYESIIDCMPGNVYWLDKDAIAIGCNKNVLDMFGFKSLEEFKGLTFEEMGKIGHWLPEATQSFKKDTLEVINTGKAKLNIEEPPIPHSNGGMIYFLSSRVPLFDNSGFVIGVVGISIDITERKKIEEALKEAKEKAEVANNAKTEFLENMRHDIRTPVSSMVGFSELLKHEKDDNKVQKYTANLADAAKELLRFLNEVLESINVSSGEIPLLKKKFNLKKVLERVINLHNPIANEKHLNIELLYDDNIPTYLLGDSSRIYRIMLELLVNALKFTKEGYVKIVAKLAAKKERDLVIQIEIEDTGPGIPKERQQDLFVQFARMSPSYEGIYKGSGLGLSIAKQFVDDLKGEIYYDDKHKNKGAKFIFVIPLTQSLLENDVGENNYDAISSYSPLIADQLNAKAIPIKFPIPPKSAIRVLMVEDHLLAASVAQELLAKFKCNVEIAISGEMAVKLASENHYDIIFMDIGLPDMNGYEVTKRIRLGEDSSYHRTSIIGLTAHVDAEKKKQGVDLGMNIVLTKPLMESTVVELLKNFVPDYLTKEVNLHDYKIVDFEYVEKVLSSDSEFLTKMLKTFVDSFEEETHKLELAHFQQDWNKIEEITHKLRGGCSYCGAFRLKEACNQLMEHINNSDLELREHLYQQIKQEMQALKWYLECSESSKQVQMNE